MKHLKHHESFSSIINRVKNAADSFSFLDEQDFIGIDKNMDDEQLAQSIFNNLDELTPDDIGDSGCDIRDDAFTFHMPVKNHYVVFRRYYKNISDKVDTIWMAGSNIECSKNIKDQIYQKIRNIKYGRLK